MKQTKGERTPSFSFDWQKIVFYSASWKYFEPWGWRELRTPLITEVSSICIMWQHFCDHWYKTLLLRGRNIFLPLKSGDNSREDGASVFELLLLFISILLLLLFVNFKCNFLYFWLKQNLILLQDFEGCMTEDLKTIMTLKSEGFFC